MKNNKKNSETRVITGMLTPAIVVVGILIIYPLFRGIVMAFQKYTLWDIFDRHFNGFDNFIVIFSNPQFPQILLNTFLWVFVSLFFQFSLGFLLAMLLRNKFKLSGLYQGIVYVPWAISGFLIGLIWRWLMNGQSGAINDILMRFGFIEEQILWLSDVNISLWSVIIANIWYGIPFFAIMIQAALKSVPLELYEAADIDGCPSFGKFWHVTLPFIKPVLILTTLLRAIWILNFPDLIYTMTNGGPAGSSHILTTYTLDLLMFNQDYGQASAVSVVVLAILLSYAIFYLQVTKFEDAGDF